MTDHRPSTSSRRLPWPIPATDLADWAGWRQMTTNPHTVNAILEACPEARSSRTTPQSSPILYMCSAGRPRQEMEWDTLKTYKTSPVVPYVGAVQEGCGRYRTFEGCHAHDLVIPPWPRLRPRLHVSCRVT